ncbi:MAG: hypothetical protein AABX04_03315 [Nanoarchaeota archaeon]
MITRKKDEKEEGITESFLGGIPLLGDFFKKLGKTETFKKRFEEVDEQIKENLKKGEKKKWGFEANFSVRPIMNEVRKETSELSVHEDYFYGKKGNKLTLAVKVPQEKVSWKIDGKNLHLEADNFEKEIELPGYFKEVKKKQYREGILVLELAK